MTKNSKQSKRPVESGSDSGYDSSLHSQITRTVAERSRLDRELTLLRRKAESIRPWHDCLRCGHHWQGLWIDRFPRYCSRCHSAGWNTPPRLANSRRPDSPPNPNWNRKKQAGVSRGFQYTTVPPSPIPPEHISPGIPAIGNVPGFPKGMPMVVPLVLGLPATGLPPPPSLDAPRLPPPPVEPAGEQFARPVLTLEPDPGSDPVPIQPDYEPAPEPDEPDIQPEPDEPIEPLEPPVEPEPDPES